MVRIGQMVSFSLDGHGLASIAAPSLLPLSAEQSREMRPWDRRLHRNSSLSQKVFVCIYDVDYVD